MTPGNAYQKKKSQVQRKNREPILHTREMEKRAKKKNVLRRRERDHNGVFRWGSMYLRSCYCGFYQWKAEQSSCQEKRLDKRGSNGEVWGESLPLAELMYSIGGESLLWTRRDKHDAAAEAAEKNE